MTLIRDFVLFSLVLCFISLGTIAQPVPPDSNELDSSAVAEAPEPAFIQLKGEPVLFYGDTLLFLYEKLGPYTAKSRARAVGERLVKISKQVAFNPDLLVVNQDGEGYDIVYDTLIVFTITKADAQNAGVDQFYLASEKVDLIREKLLEERKSADFKVLAIRLGLLLISLLGLYIAVRLIHRLFRFLLLRIHSVKDKYLKGVKLRDLELVTPDKTLEIALLAIKVIRFFVYLLLFYIALPLVFSIFPATRGFSGKLFGYILSPIKSILWGFVNYIPNLFTILVIVIATRYLLRLLNYVAKEVANETLVLPGFYSDWAKPTYNIVRFIVYAFMFIMIFPYLPGSDSPVFQGVSVFLGLLLSLGSSSAISNAVAGLVITYMRPFKIGERVKIGDVTGDVLEKTMLVTRLRTIKNEDVTIPNASILNGHTINYSSSAQTLGLILNTTVTIGYDVQWKDVQRILIEAAAKCSDIEKEQSPFVFQTSLDDFYVSYQLNAYTKAPHKAAKIYSELHQNIQDGFNEAGIEILSPHYRAARDGNQVTIPANYLPDDYKAPAFGIKNIPNDK